MVFVPLPLFATLVLAFVCAHFVMNRDMSARPHQLFAGLMALYAVQSLLVSLRWGYGVEPAAGLMAILAPILPAMAYIAYKTLFGQNGARRLWPLAIIVLNWIVFAAVPDLADAVIIATYLGFGGILLWLFWRGEDQLTLSPIGDGRDILAAMGLTGAALVASGLTDLYVVYDFVSNDGRNAALVLTFAQTALVLVIGVSAVFGQAADADKPAAERAPVPVDQSPPNATDADEDILNRLALLFNRDRLHLTDDLSVRRLSRRLGVSDRQVSQAVNRIKGMSVSQFVNEHRVKEACRLLRETDDTILHVSLASGFATKSNFNREFSRVTGQTPSQWRAATPPPVEG
ncbi:AraC family transcriptional regulator [uncultured Pelagimonas sp.]|uniref:helix-turn-helix domain-containing protein n=1 Tax=uncultured Pelagimonas sp. TaxID=1618102 RepID=UPI002633918D|nr:AraC family transcriptional regulator [uncultured Pelagimonas sp.]